MTIDYQYLSQEEQEEVIAGAILDRESEYHNYEVNRINYDAILAKLAKEEDLPTVWPPHLAPYKGLYGEALAAQVGPDDYYLITRMQFRDRIVILRATTITERDKSGMIHMALHTQLPEPERRHKAVERVRAKRAQMQAARFRSNGQ